MNHSIVTRNVKNYLIRTNPNKTLDLNRGYVIIALRVAEIALSLAPRTSAEQLAPTARQVASARRPQWIGASKRGQKPALLSRLGSSRTCSAIAKDRPTARPAEAEWADFCKPHKPALGNLGGFFFSPNPPNSAPARLLHRFLCARTALALVGKPAPPNTPKLHTLPSRQCLGVSRTTRTAP